MKYYEHKYRTYFLVTKASSKLLWLKQNWDEILPKLIALSAEARDKAAVRSSQFEPDNRTEARFGRLGLNQKSSDKWTLADEAQRKFISAEIWAPSWNRCVREKIPPDFIFSFQDHLPLTRSGPRQYRTILVFGVREQSVIKGEDQLFDNLSEYLDPIIKGRKVRPWGIKIPNSKLEGYQSALQDMKTVGIFKGGNWQDKVIDKESLKEEWEVC